jgi:hypothetical protein
VTDPLPPNGVPGRVIRVGHVIATIEPVTYWSAELGGFVSMHEAATYYPSAGAAGGDRLSITESGLPHQARHGDRTA